ncbi:siderophore-interacting protein [Gluconacetobacter tumulisoli]|uniref:Siderophore-interacting protein n=1 Tax=Gluconacetobacter tumulisoli TaxID=1286189 RepID=A0A7W4PN54_9PROT|nr:siderophore-interacting protein [Gluconacetobacter tumulisoli]MBB2200516.1 siderophore-interacting protein [Gluconacetobacter tumulisoli]
MTLLFRTPVRLRHPLRLRHVQVARVEQLSPRMRRIVFTGPTLEGFTSAAADDHVKLFFPPPGTDRPILPDPGAGPGAAGDGPPPVSRDYTPRRFDPATGELSVEFVLHGDGPATTWAAQARPGQWLGVGGPRGSVLIPDDYAAYLLIGDETALPAIARRLEELPPGTRVTALIEVADSHEERRLPTAADATIVWLHRNGTPAGQSPVLDEALRRLPLPTRDIHVWIGAEIETARRLRAHLMADEALDRRQIRAAGYWRRGAANGGARIEDPQADPA